MRYFDANIAIKLMLNDQLSEYRWHPNSLVPPQKQNYYNYVNDCPLDNQFEKMATQIQMKAAQKY